MAVVVVPFGGGDLQRRKAWDFLRRCYEAVYPGYQVVVAHYEAEPWCKAEAVMPALRNAPSDVVIVADADCWSDGLESAVRAITVGAAEWGMPHKTVYRLTEEASESWLMTNGPEGPRAKPMTGPLKTPMSASKQTERRPYEGVWGGGIVVAHRDTFLNVPLDPRFKGPGQEDESWGLALWTLAGPGWRGKAPLYHLHHPPLPRLSARRGSVKSWDLYRRYAMANRKPDEMRRLIEEFNVTSDPDVETVPHHPANVVG